MADVARRRAQRTKGDVDRGQREERKAVVPGPATSRDQGREKTQGRSPNQLSSFRASTIVVNCSGAGGGGGMGGIWGVSQVAGSATITCTV